MTAMPLFFSWVLTSVSMPPIYTALFIMIIIWSLAWKGVALWKAARNNQVYWFIALLIINTLGILEIIYIYVFAKKQPENGNSSQITNI